MMCRSIVFSFCVIVVQVSFSADKSGQYLAAYLNQEIKAGHVVGAQVLTGTANSVRPRSYNLGQIGPNDARAVTRKTVFCIASCSKPVASAVIFTLLDQRKLKLSQPVGEVVSEMADCNFDGKTVRSPTLRELLAHRGGIYSQKENPTQNQMSAIRDFRLTLEESVAKISGEPLSSVPGTKYAYSGAGYCVLGRMAELATEFDFEELLQKNICQPLGMNSTTYFPDNDQLPEIAAGGRSGFTPPHTLGPSLKFSLIGGSLYTSATDLSKLLRVVINKGELDGKRVMSTKAVAVFTGPAFDTQQYGFGWRLSKSGGKVTALSHKGSLPPYQASVHIDLRSRTYKIVLWTLAKPSNVQATTRVQSRVAKLVAGN